MTRTPPIPVPAAAALAAVAATIAAVSCSVAPTATLASGERIYRQTCADCHGPRGEGVDQKYKEALVGDWAPPRLARYIAKNPSRIRSSRKSGFLSISSTASNSPPSTRPVCSPPGLIPPRRIVPRSKTR